MEALAQPNAQVALSTHIRDLFLSSTDELIKRDQVTSAQFSTNKNVHQEMYICRNLGFNILQGFLFNKGCFLAQIFSRGINRAAAMNLIARLKLNAGVQTHVHRKETTASEKVSLNTFQDRAIIYFYAWSAAIMTLILENVLSRWRNSQGSYRRVFL